MSQGLDLARSVGVAVVGADDNLYFRYRVAYTFVLPARSKV